MTMTETYSGWISEREYGDTAAALFISAYDVPLCEILEWMTGQKCSVRYWICPVEMSKEQANEAYLKTLMGDAEVEFSPRYSEVTGYLWTDENLKIGGHDLLSELFDSVGQFLILEVESE